MEIGDKKMSIYKGNKVVAGGSIDTHFVRRPAWNQAVEISIADLTAGYKAPADGMFVCTGVMPTANTNVHRIITVNNVPIAMGQYNSANVFSYGSTSCPVSKGDLIKASNSAAWSDETRYFVPFEDSTVSDIEVVTPDLIRNLHDPDWSQAVAITAKQLVAGYTTPGRGIVVGWVATKDVSGSTLAITVNGIVIGASSFYANGWASYPSIQVPVNKNDVIKAIQEDISSSKNINMSFVPYKAQ